MDFSEEANIRWKKKFASTIDHINKNHENLLKEKARLIGFIMGDGCISPINKQSHHDIRFYPDDVKVAEIFISDFEKLYLKKPVIKNLGRYFSVHVSSKPAWEDLIKRGKFDSLNWEFPDNLKSKKEKIEWLKALFDCEAYVDIKKKRISFQTISREGIDSIQNLLREFNINSKIYVYTRKNPKWNKNYLLFIMGKENVYNFSQQIGFNHSSKKEKLMSLSWRAGVVNGTVSKTVPLRAPRFES